MTRTLPLQVIVGTVPPGSCGPAGRSSRRFRTPRTAARRAAATGRIVALLTILIALGTATAQDAPADDPLIAVDLPRNVEVGVLLEYVSERLGFNVIYDESQVRGRITLETPERLPASALLDLVQVALKGKGLLLVDSEQPGFKTVIPAENFLALAPPPQVGPVPDDAGPTDVVTRVFVLNNADPAAVEPVIAPLLTSGGGGGTAIPNNRQQGGGNLSVLPEQNLIVVSDFAPVVRRVADVIDLLDNPTREVATRVVPVANSAPADLAERLQTVLTARLRAAGVARPERTGVEIVPDPRTNGLVLIGPPERVDTAAETIAALDQPVEQAQSPVRFYKLANTTATEVLATIRAIEGEEQFAAASFGDGVVTREIGVGPQTPADVDAQPILRDQTDAAPIQPVRGFVTEPDLPGTRFPGRDRTSVVPETPSLGFANDRARVAADPNTNTIIVIADPVIQRQYEELISRLDRRRPQVLIEAAVVTIDVSDGLSTGVDIAYSDRDGDPQIIAFDSFGVSQVNPITGRLNVRPQLGFNAAVLSSDVADVVLRALATSRDARVVSAPRILVNDNAEGRLASVAESPFSLVNAFETIATTSFDYATAGTTIRLVPHISEDDYLQLEYEVELSSFTAPAQGGAPPPRQENSVQSEVTIPDGSTIIVGGLNSSNISESVNKVPLLGDIPLLGLLFSSREVNVSETALFVFLRPTILRDDAFADLRYLSREDVIEAGLPPDLPASEPVLMTGDEVIP